MWWWPVDARAQEEACAPVPAEVLARHLADAEAALADGSDARAPATTAHEAARCLSVPAPKDALGRLAWIQAELAARDLDEGRAWEWIRLARSVGAAESAVAGPELREITESGDGGAPGAGGPTGVVLAIPAKGSVYADGVVIDHPELTLSTHHLVQVFDAKGARTQGAWQMGGSFPSHLLTTEALDPARSGKDRRSADAPPDGWKPARKNTEAAYRDWITKHPEGPWLDDALYGIDDLHWAAAVTAGTELAARQYLHDHPEGFHRRDARFVVEDLAYRAVMEDPTRAAWQELLDDAPDGMYATEAAVQLDALDWKDARTTDTPTAYLRYLELWPEGRNAGRARELEEERRFDAAIRRGADDVAAFLAAAPDSPWADEAKALLGGIKLRRVSVVVEPGELPAAVPTVTAALRGELVIRGFRVVDKDADATLRAVLGTTKRQGLLFATAKVALDVPGLDRPLIAQVVDAPILATDDPGAALAAALPSNLMPTDPWRSP